MCVKKTYSPWRRQTNFRPKYTAVRSPDHWAIFAQQECLSKETLSPKTHILGGGGGDGGGGRISRPGQTPSHHAGISYPVRVQPLTPTYGDKPEAPGTTFPTFPIHAHSPESLSPHLSDERGAKANSNWPVPRLQIYRRYWTIDFRLYIGQCRNKCTDIS